MGSLDSINERWKGLDKKQRLGVIVAGVGIGVVVALRRRKTAATPTATPEPSANDWATPSDTLAGGGGGLGGGMPGGPGSDSTGGLGGTTAANPNDAPYLGVVPDALNVTAARTSPVPVADDFGLPYGSAGYFGNGGAGGGGIWGTLGYAQKIVDAGGTLKSADGSTIVYLEQVWANATPEQTSSPEFVDTWNSLNKEAGGSGRKVPTAVRQPVTPTAGPVNVTPTSAPVNVVQPWLVPDAPEPPPLPADSPYTQTPNKPNVGTQSGPTINNPNIARPGDWGAL